jgi:beta-glucosidase
MIRGMQSQGVSACPKHFAVNSQETRRMVIDEVVDERALRELYLEGFRYAVTEGKPKTVMSSYNRVNGTFANENTHLLQDVLYGEWGYEGIVVTDWGGENDRVAGLVAGNQLEMPSSAGVTDGEIVEAVRAGCLNESLLDERVDSLLRLVFESSEQAKARLRFSAAEHLAAAREAACKAAVLVKNEGNVLPLTDTARVTVIGEFAKIPRYQGAGSSLIVPTRLTSAIDALRKDTELTLVGYEPGFHRFGGKSKRKHNRAVALARRADIALVFLGLDEGSEAEGVDRLHMRLPENQIELLRAVRAVTKTVIAVVSGGSPVEAEWAEYADAVLLTYLGGQECGGAVADLLTGVVSPSGKLAETYPVSYTDVPSAGNYPGKELTAEHRESIYIGYRYYDAANKPVTWPFGYGLTYTTFDYSDLSIERDEVAFTIHNTGARAGEDIAQVYITKKESAVFRAQKELKGFIKVALVPGETKRVSVRLDEHAFRYFNVAENAWVEEPGEYDVLVGASSREIRLTLTVTRAGESVNTPNAASELPHYYKADPANVSDAEFAALLGRPLPQSGWDREKPLCYHDTIGQGRYKRGFARFLYGMVRTIRRICFLVGHPVAANNVMFAMNLPYRQLARLTGGTVDQAMLDGILVMANGQFWRGLGQTLRACGRKRRRRGPRNEN